MISTQKDDYCKLKQAIKLMCKDSVDDLCSEVGLSDYERLLVHAINKNKTRTSICIDLNASESKVSKDMRKVFSKIYDYDKRNNLSIY